MLSYTYLMGVDSSTPTCLKRGNMSLIVDVTTAISNVFENNDIRLVEVNFEKRHDGNYLVVYIDKDSGVKLEDCEYVHNSIDPILDQLDPHSKSTIQFGSFFIWIGQTSKIQMAI